MQRYNSIRLFKNPYLERLSHVHPITPLILWGPVAVWLIWRSLFVLELDPWGVSGIGLLALFTWTLTEYLLHRYVFHYEGESARSKRFHFLIHGLHHDDPSDPTRLVFPPVPAFLMAMIHYYIFKLFLGPHWVQPFFGFFIIGYLCYDYIHYAVHHFTPRTRIGKYLKQSHMIHHFVAPESRWGVSSPLWDYFFGTLEAERKQGTCPEGKS